MGYSYPLLGFEPFDRTGDPTQTLVPAMFKAFGREELETKADSQVGFLFHEHFFAEGLDRKSVV